MRFRYQPQGCYSGTGMQCAAGIRLRGVTVELERNVLQVSASGLLQWNWNAVCSR
jgi:hypothetical protein